MADWVSATPNGSKSKLQKKIDRVELYGSLDFGQGGSIFSDVREPFLMGLS